MAKGMVDWALKEWRIQYDDDLNEYIYFQMGNIIKQKK